jgi:hypothetical protein
LKILDWIVWIIITLIISITSIVGGGYIVALIFSLPMYIGVCIWFDIIVTFMIFWFMWEFKKAPIMEDPDYYGKDTKEKEEV